MRRLGCLIALVGMLVAAASVFLFGAAIARLAHPNAVVMVPLPLIGQELPIPGGARVRLWLRLELDTGGVEQGDGARVGRYALPLTWRVGDGRGGDLVGGATTLAWNDAARASIEEHASQEAANLVAEHPLGKLALPRDARATAWAALGEDASWHARVRRAWLVARDDETDSGALALGGAALLTMGPMLVAAGFATVVLSFFVKRKRKRKQGEAPSAKAGLGDPPGEDVGGMTN